MLPAIRTAAKRAFISSASRLLSSARPRVNVLYVWKDFARKAGAIDSVLRSRGFPSQVHSPDNVLSLALTKARDRDVTVGFWNVYPLYYLPAKYIFYNAEPIGLENWSNNHNLQPAIEGAAEVWNYHPVADDALSAMVPSWRPVPFGYAEYYEEEYRRSVGGEVQETVDVLFVGSLTDRRVGLLQRLRDAGLSVLEVTRDNPLHGADLDLAIARAKIVVNLHRFSGARGHIADMARLDYLLANKRCVVHERTNGTGDPRGFADVVPMASADELVDVCRELSDNDTLRRARASDAHEWFRRTLHFDSYLPFDTIERLLSR